jgi:hypothetical protein
MFKYVVITENKIRFLDRERKVLKELLITNDENWFWEYLKLKYEKE